MDLGEAPKDTSKEEGMIQPCLNIKEKVGQKTAYKHDEDFH